MAKEKNPKFEANKMYVFFSIFLAFTFFFMGSGLNQMDFTLKIAYMIMAILFLVASVVMGFLWAESAAKLA